VAPKSFILYFLLLQVLACSKKETDSREKFTGSYFLTGPCSYTFDAYGQYWVMQGLDTASFSISLSPDSSNYVLFNGVIISNQPSEYTLKFKEEGIPVLVKVNGNEFIIPKQFPYRGGSSIVEGTAVFNNGEISLKYLSHYRGLTKSCSLQGRKK
jgi:hypothetical protein